MHQNDLIVIGGGIVGLATAYRFTERFPGRRVTVLDKEPDVGRHQTGHNSGVLHSGIYYRPGSLKATNCRAGKEALVAFCREEGIPHEICGKVIVAVDRAELSALERIYHNGQANGVQCTLIDRDRLTELEPHASGIRAIHVPEAGIVDFVAVCLRLAKRVRQRDGQIRTGTRVVGIRSVPGGVVIDTTAGEFAAQHAINCGGLYCDRIAELAEIDNKALKDLLEEMDTGEIDVELTGFDEAAIEGLMTQFHVEGVDPQELPDGDTFPFQQMTFTVHAGQVEQIAAALAKAKKAGGGQSTVNKNSNGNALAWICQEYNDG